MTTNEVREGMESIFTSQSSEGGLSTIDSAISIEHSSCTFENSLEVSFLMIASF
jgi:hypothetical protein